jgi:hypothetical protein
MQFFTEVTKTPSEIKTLMQVFVSFVVMSGALYIVLSLRYTAAEKHWAFGSLGTILGLWLRVQSSALHALPATTRCP